MKRLPRLISCDALALRVQRPSCKCQVSESSIVGSEIQHYTICAASNALLSAVNKSRPILLACATYPTEYAYHVQKYARPPALTFDNTRAKNQCRDHQRESPTVSASANRLTNGTIIEQKEANTSVKPKACQCQARTRPATAPRRVAGLRVNRAEPRDKTCSAHRFIKQYYCPNRYDTLYTATAAEARCNKPLYIPQIPST